MTTELIINIPERLYTSLKERPATHADNLAMYEYIINGVPLEECKVEDCISRKLAIEALNDTWGELVNPTIDDYINALKQLTSESPKSDDWISKKLALRAICTKSDNLCDSCINSTCIFQSGIVRNKCDFYMPHLEPNNCGNYVVIQPTVEAILKDQCEERLKADLKAILVELQLEIEEIDSRAGYDGNGMPTFANDYVRIIKVNEIIQQKIDKLKEQNND